MLGDSSQVELITKHAITNNLILHNVCSIKYLFNQFSQRQRAVTVVSLVHNLLF